MAKVIDSEGQEHDSIEAFFNSRDSKITWYESLWWGFTEVFKRIFVSAPRKMKYRLQKMLRGYSDLDIWNANTAIAKFVTPLLKDLLQQNKAVPLSIYDECNENADLAFKRWSYYQRLMIFSFEYETYLSGSLSTKKEKEFERKYLLSSKALEVISVDDPDSKRLQYLSKRQKRGLELFAQYFNDLWY